MTSCLVPRLKNILPQSVYRILTQILRDKDRNGKDHNQIFGPDKKGHFKIGFIEPNKIGILKFQSVKERRQKPNFTKQSRPLQHNAAFHQGLSKTKSISRERNPIFLEIITCDASIYTMDHPDFIVCSFMENSICPKRVKAPISV